MICLEPSEHVGPERRLAQPHVVERDRAVDDVARDAELVAQEAAGVLGQRRPRPRLAPAPEHLLAPHETALVSPSSAPSSSFFAARRNMKRPNRAIPRPR